MTILYVKLVSLSLYQKKQISWLYMCEKEEMPKAKTVPSFSTLIQDSSELYAVNYFFSHTLILESPSKHPFILKTLLLKKKKKKNSWFRSLWKSFFFSLLITYHQNYLHFLIYQLQSGFLFLHTYYEIFCEKVTYDLIMVKLHGLWSALLSMKIHFLTFCLNF